MNNVKHYEVVLTSEQWTIIVQLLDQASKISDNPLNIFEVTANSILIQLPPV